MIRETSLLELLQEEQDAVSCYNMAVDALEILQSVDGSPCRVQECKYRQRITKAAIAAARIAIKQHLKTIREVGV